MRGCLHFLAVASVVSLATAQAQTVRPIADQLKNPRAADVTIVAHVLEPQKKSLDRNLKRISLPRGFEINVFARDLINPRMLAVADDGTVYVTRRDVGDVIMLRDTNNDGEADQQTVVANRPGMHGIAIDGNTMYLATVKDVYRTTIRPDGRLDLLEHLVNDLPDGGQHPNRTLALGADGKLYVSVGSSCNACDETNPEHATMLQMEPDGSSRTIFAAGLRNTVGFAFEPGSGELWGMDHGIDWLGDNEQYEELNHIVKGKQYGWPYIYDDGKFNPQDEPPGEISHAEWAARSIEPLGFHTPHAAPMQMTFYTGDQFPAEYRGDAFVAMRGSWNRKPPAGYEIARINFEGGKPTGFEAFAQGFLQRQGKNWVHYGRLAGLTETPDGALLFSDDTNGVIYRITYTGKNKGKSNLGTPTNSGNVRVRVVNANPPAPDENISGGLAIEILNEERADMTLAVESKAFASGESIPEKFSADGEDISPPLKWTRGPQGTKSYVVMMEDPDAPDPSPFVHWLLYNIPADVTQLEKGVPAAAQIPKPEGALQGKNDRGSIGYFGPKPPVEDPAHNYHFQVFALDKELDISFGATRVELISAMRGHVLSSGDLVGTYAR